MKEEIIKYRDKFLWFWFYPLAAFCFIFVGNDNSFSQLIRLPSFGTDVIFALLTTFAVGAYIKIITQRLDVKFLWRIQIRKRLVLQFFFGFLLPLIISMLLEASYLKAIGLSLADSSILYLEMPLAAMLLLLINCYYAIGHLYYFENKAQSLPANSSQADTEGNISFFIVHKGYETIKISKADCALIRSQEKVVWLYTYDNTIYRLEGTLEEWHTKLGSDFFRINRQYLASAASIQGVIPTETRKLHISFTLPEHHNVYVSKANAASFRKWWKEAGTL